MNNEKAWRKSSYSGAQGGNCVEVARQLNSMRDSKDPNGSVLSVGTEAFNGFLASAKAGRFDR